MNLISEYALPQNFDFNSKKDVYNFLVVRKEDNGYILTEIGFSKYFPLLCELMHN